MTLDEVAARLFATHAIATDPSGALRGTAGSAAGRPLAVVGIAGGKPIGIEAAALIADAVLDVVDQGGAQGKATPIVVLVATGSQAMARRDELLGLNEHLAHLTKVLAVAASAGHRTIGILYGQAAAGAFIATALATETLVALPGAEPSVMDLPSIARVTKLALESLHEMARTTPIFAPGLEHLESTGAVAESWGADEDWGRRLDALLGRASPARDERGRLGAERRGRLVSEDVAERVRRAVTNDR